MRRVSLADVARAAGVAKATASRALSQNHRDVGEATRARIQSIAEDMGYQPSRVAQALRTGRFQVLGFLPPEHHPDWAALVHGACIEATSRGYHVLVHPVRHGTTPWEQAAELAIDGFVAVSNEIASPDADATQSVNSDRPVVFIGQHRAPQGAVVVRPGEFGAGALACRHLLEQGSRAIAVIIPNPAGTVAQDRLAGCRETLREYGIESVAELPHPETTARTTAETTDRTTSIVRRIETLDELLVTGRALDGIVTLSPGHGLQALSSLRNAGREVPGDVKVIGFDDPVVATLAQPSLSSVQVAPQQLGALAVARLVQIIEGHSGGAHIHTVSAMITVRESSSAAQPHASVADPKS